MGPPAGIAQLADLDARAARLDESRRRVRGLLDRIADGPPDSDLLLSTLELTVPLVDVRAHLNAAQLGALLRQGDRVGAEAVATLKSQWLDLLMQGRELVRAQVPAADPRARALAARWREIGQALRGGTAVDEGLNFALAALWRDRAGTIDEGLAKRVTWLDAGDLTAVRRLHPAGGGMP